MISPRRLPSTGLRALLVPVAMLLAGACHACSLSPEAYDLKAALAAPDSTEQVFYGRVVSAGQVRVHDGWMLRTLVQVHRWYRGTPKNRVWLVSYVTYDQTSCSGAFNFSADVGDEMLFVASGPEGALQAHGLLSVPLAARGKALFDRSACVRGRLEDVAPTQIAGVGECLAHAASAARFAREFPH